MKRGVKTLVVGGLVLLIGLVVIPAVTMFSLISNDNAETRFVAPGTAQVQIEDPGRYYLWNEYQTVYQGTSYNQSDLLPRGLNIVITDDQGNQLTFTADTTMSTTVGSKASKSIGYVEVLQPCQLMIDASGISDQYVFSLSKFRLGQFLGLVFGVGCFSTLLTLTGLGIGIWGIVKLLTKPEVNGMSAAS